MALADVNATWTPSSDANADEQDIYIDSQDPAQFSVATQEPMSTSSASRSAVAAEGETWYGRVVTRDTSSGATAEHTWTIGQPAGPSLTWVSPADGASLTEGNTQALAVDVTANAHAGAGQVGGITDIRFEYSTDGSTYTTIGTAKCDDTTTPQASLDWTVLASVTNLRAVCVDSGGAEVGTAAVIAVTVGAPAPTYLNDYDFSGDPSTGTLADNGTSPAPLSFTGSSAGTVTAGSDGNGSFWDFPEANVLSTGTPTISSSAGRVEINYAYQAGASTIITLFGLIGSVNATDYLVLIDQHTVIDQLRIELHDTAGNSDRVSVSTSPNTFIQAVFEWDVAADSLIITVDGVEQFNGTISSQVAGWNGSIAAVDSQYVAGLQDGIGNISRDMLGQMYALRTA
jgi:hypothetical protein